MSELSPPQPGAGPGHRDFSIGTCFSEAWAATWAGFPSWLGVYVVGWVLAVLAIVTIVGIVLALPVLGWGGVRYLLNLHDRRGSIGDLFSGFSRYTEALVAMLVVGLAIGLIGFVGQLVSLAGEQLESTPVIAVGALVNLAWYLLIVPRFNFAYLYAVDLGESPVDALRNAWERTAAVKWKVAGLMLLSVLVMFGVALPAILIVAVGAVGEPAAAALAALALCALLVIAASMFLYLAWVSAYRQMEGPAPAPAPPIPA